MLKACLVNYNYDPTYLKQYPNLEVSIYDRSDDNIERDLTKYGKVFKTQNRGDVDADKLAYLVDNYDNLPEIFLWGKTNLFKFTTEEALTKAIEEKKFAPLLKQDHRTYSDKYGVVNYYQDGMYYERADSWFFNADGVDVRYFPNWQAWCNEFGIPLKPYTPFPPGGNFLLTRERVHRYSRDFYDTMRSVMLHSTRPVEAQCAERTYYTLWQ